MDSSDIILSRHILKGRHTMKTESIVCECGSPVTMEEVIEVGKPNAVSEPETIFVGYYCFACNEIGQQLVGRREWNTCYLGKYLEV